MPAVNSTHLQTAPPDALAEAITRLRRTLGERLVIMAHHYQHDEVVRHADITGDSLELARRVPDLGAAHIVFCGVYFMAETAAILAAPGQTVHLPDLEADCIMAAMAPASRVAAVLAHLASGGRRVVPLAYVNSSAAVKAVVGRHGGAVCTSANAETMMRWALKLGDAVLFLPDRNLAWNTADRLGLPENERLVLDVRGDGRRLDPAAARSVRLFAWPGMCAIHHRMKPAHVAQARAADPQALVVVHPECRPEVVALADASGSTRGIIDYCNRAPEGAVIYVGTEIRLVRRLAARHAPSKRILPLLESACENMGKISAAKLLACLQRLDGPYAVQVGPEEAAPARAAVERMLEVCAGQTPA
jgi:quinolinate synthase